MIRSVARSACDSWACLSGNRHLGSRWRCNRLSWNFARRIALGLSASAKPLVL